MKRAFLVFVFAVAVILTGMETASAIDLKTISQDSFPKYFLKEDGSVGGISVDILKAVHNIDPFFNFIGLENLAPASRILEDLKTGDIDFFCGLARTQKREALYNYPQTPLYSFRYILVARADDPISIDSEKSLAHTNHVVLGLLGSKSIAEAEANGVTTDTAKNIELCLRKLLFGRGRFVKYHDMGMLSTAKKMGILHKIRVVYEYPKVNYHYIPFSKRVPQEIVDRFDRALIKLHEAGD